MITIKELVDKTGWEWLNSQAAPLRPVTNGCCCDLLSWVMASGEEGMAWVTVQTHMNVVAIASLHEFSCIILSEGNAMEGDVLEKASAEGIAVLRTRLSSYQACCHLCRLGVGV
jgi:hypothetical protein